MKKKTKNKLYLELNGKVFLIEKSNGRITSKEEIDGKLVLESLKYVIRDSLELMEKNMGTYGR